MISIYTQYLPRSADLDPLPRPVYFFAMPRPVKKKPSQSISATDAKLFILTETSPWQTANLVMSTKIDHDHIVKSVHQKSWGDGLWCSLLSTNGPALPRWGQCGNYHKSWYDFKITGTVPMRRVKFDPKQVWRRCMITRNFIVENRNLSGSTTSRCCKLVLENWTSKRLVRTQDW